MEKTLSWRVRIFAVIGIMLAVLGLTFGPHADAVPGWLRWKADQVEDFVRYHTDHDYRARVDGERFWRDQEVKEREWSDWWWGAFFKAQRHIIASGMDPELSIYLDFPGDDVVLRGHYYVDGFRQDMDVVLWGKNCINRKGDLVVLELEDGPVAFIIPDAPADQVRN